MVFAWQNGSPSQSTPSSSSSRGTTARRPEAPAGEEKDDGYLLGDGTAVDVGSWVHGDGFIEGHLGGHAGPLDDSVPDMSRPATLQRCRPTSAPTERSI